MACRHCSKPLPVSLRGRPRVFCDAVCSRLYWRSARRKPALEPRTCGQCGLEFVPWRRDQRFCNDRCGHSFHRRKSEQPWNARRRANYQKRRALKKAAPIGDPVLLAEIRERDRNLCGICGERVNGKAYPHPLSASLDHVVPLSVGGAHDPTNVQLAHLRCNVSKGNRGGGEQLRMV